MFIYKISKEGDDNFYIGKTNDFSRRKRAHKYNCKKQKDRKLYNYINENGGWNCFKCEWIEQTEDKNREKELVNELQPSLNTYKLDWCPRRNYNIKIHCDKCGKNVSKGYFKDHICKKKEDGKIELS